ncbi:MAG: glycosyltransferase family 8 protein [Puniceicoccales bacterium]|jgi:lipopolysaccharide biosynthesis glycosyltransferase|nr:glycosyltransferase family 8 protein [Puniceicoccales bacterium]
MVRCENIAIVLTCDDNYVRHASATIASTVENSQRKFNFYIFDCGISNSNLDRIQSMDILQKGQHALHVVKPPKQRCFEEFPLPAHFSPAIFYRVCIPEILRNQEKVIYLDSDIIVEGDLGDLWDQPLENYWFGAVYLDNNFIKDTQLKKFKANIGLEENKRYFNSGVMLMNLVVMRNERVLYQVLDFLRKNPHIKLSCPEQDILNLIVDRSNIFELAPKYNFTPFSPLAKKTAKLGKPVCIHFSVYKPWNFPQRIVKLLKKTYIFKLFHLYYVYAQLTPWANIPCETARFSKVIKLVCKTFTQPMERFIRFSVRDRIKSHIFNAKN